MKKYLIALVLCVPILMFSGCGSGKSECMACGAVAQMHDCPVCYSRVCEDCADDEDYREDIYYTAYEDGSEDGYETGYYDGYDNGYAEAFEMAASLLGEELTDEQWVYLAIHAYDHAKKTDAEYGSGEYGGVEWIAGFFERRAHYAAIQKELGEES